MKVVIINKSDSTGGAAVVSFRLMEALRQAGVDAKMVVCEKLSDSPFVALASSPTRIKRSFLTERLKIFLANGLNRTTLFKIDTASDGLRLYHHPWVKEADVVCLNWINQGMMSLRGIADLLKEKKKVIWTMHDMWNMTGVCHHAGTCTQFIEGECRRCPLLKKAFIPSLAHSVSCKKSKLYNLTEKIHFVAVSSWLKSRALASSLLRDQEITVIPNPFPFENETYKPRKTKNSRAENRIVRLLFGAARLDDPIKGLPTLIETTRILADKYPEIARHLQLVTFGTAKDPEAFDGCALSLDARGRLSGRKAIREVYEECDIVISTSHYETLPGTLVEAQAYGCLPVAFARGGQRDIIDDGKTGLIVEWSDNIRGRAENMASAIVKAVGMLENPTEGEHIRKTMWESAFSRFNGSAIASAYIRLFNR